MLHRTIVRGPVSTQRRRGAALHAAVQSLEGRRLLSDAPLNCGCHAKHNDPFAIGAAEVGDEGGQPGAIGAGPRSSPFDPPEGSGLYTVDAGPSLDTGCTFNDSGPFLIELEVSRIVTDVNAAIAAGTLPETVTMTMPVYDVDYAQGERDRVSVNGSAVRGNSSFFTGENNTWKLNTFTIDTRNIKFATDENTPGVNTIRVDIDVNDDGWCTAVDWVQFDIGTPNPVLFVHGINSSGNTWRNSGSDLINFEQETRDLGLEVEVIEQLQDSGGNFPIDSIQDNALDISRKVDELLDRTGAEKVTIVAHSKGGLDSRYYITYLGGHEKVDRLIQLGSPNIGSPLADLATNAATIGGAIFGGPGGALAGNLLGQTATLLIGGVGGYQLTTGFWRNFSIPAAYGVDYYAFAGDYEFTETLFSPYQALDAFMATLYGGKNDTIVPAWSVRALPGGSVDTIRSVGDNSDAAHAAAPLLDWGMTAAPSFFRRIKSLIEPTTAGARAAVVEPEGPDAVLTTVLSVPAAGGMTDSLDLPLIGGIDASVFALAPAGVKGELVAPDGTVYRTGDAAAANGVTSFADGDSGAVGFIIPAAAAAAGTWRLRLSTAAVATNEQPAIVYVAQDTPAKLDVTATPAAGGGPLTIRATLTQNGADVTSNATLVVRATRPDGSAFDVPMTLEGNAYVAMISAPQAGGWVLSVSATGNFAAGGAATRLERVVVAGVSDRTARLTDTYSQVAEDTDGDGSFDVLRITAGLRDVQSGRYLLQGRLLGPDGTLIVEAGHDVALAAGATTIELTFIGEAIFNAGLNGPYTVADLNLIGADDASLALADVDAVALVTPPYNPDDFDGQDVTVQSGTDLLIAENATAGAETLRVTLQLKAKTPGTYNFSALLFNSAGDEIGFASGTGNLTATDGQIVLDFEGEPIGAAGVDGPYFVRNLLINQISGSAAAVIAEAYTTAAHKASDFEGFIGNPNPTRPSVSGLTLVDATTDQVIGALGATITDGAAATTGRYAIRADTLGTIGSVVFTLDGRVVRVENTAAYAMFGNNGGDFFGGKLAVGAHRLVVIPYASRDGTGSAGTAFTADFTVGSPPPTPSTKVSLVDSKSDQVVPGFADVGSVVNFDRTKTPGLLTDLTVVVDGGPSARAVDFFVNGKLLKRETSAPFALFGNRGNDVYAAPGLASGTQPFKPGKIYSIEVVVYDGTGASAAVIDRRTIRLVIAPT